MTTTTATFPPRTGEEVQIEALASPSFGSCTTKMLKGWCGHAVTGVKKGADSVVAATQHTFTAINQVSLDANAVAGVFRKLEKHVLRMAEYLANTPGHLGKLATLLKRNVAIVDFVQVVGDVDYFANARFKNDTKAVVAARVAAMVADVGGALLWLEEMAFFNLSKAAAAIGNVKIFSFVPKAMSSIPVLRNCSTLQHIAKAMGEVRVFGLVTKISPLFVTLRALDLMYAFFAVDAAQRLVNADNIYKRTSAGLDLSSYLAELAISAMIFAGVTNIIGLGVMGGVCITLALSSFIYRVVHDKQLKNPLPKEDFGFEFIKQETIVEAQPERSLA